MKALMEKINKFNNDRDWDKFHSPENLSKSISIEAGELLECFQWTPDYNIDNVKDELADVFMYSMMLANELNLNIEDIILDKLNKNESRYQVDKVKGTSKKYTEL
ncbi:MAG: nucleotide pyrophosphohydrolase [Erysipelothrix sp.]|nr:nucleotide pyrophosphohydrolase [Erysipelothrix sp.]